MSNNNHCSNQAFSNPPNLSYRALAERKKRVCKGLTAAEDPFCLTEVPLSQQCGALPAPHHIYPCKPNLIDNKKNY